MVGVSEAGSVMFNVKGTGVTEGGVGVDSNVEVGDSVFSIVVVAPEAETEDGEVIGVGVLVNTAGRFDVGD